MTVRIILQVDRHSLRPRLFWPPPNARYACFVLWALRFLLGHGHFSSIAHVLVIDHLFRLIQAYHVSRLWGLHVTLTWQSALEAPIKTLLHPSLKQYLAILHRSAFIDGYYFTVAVDVVTQMIIPKSVQAILVVLGRPGRLLRAQIFWHVHVRVRPWWSEASCLRNV